MCDFVTVVLACAFQKTLTVTKTSGVLEGICESPCIERFRVKTLLHRVLQTRSQPCASWRTWGEGVMPFARTFLKQDLSCTWMFSPLMESQEKVANTMSFPPIGQPFFNSRPACTLLSKLPRIQYITHESSSHFLFHHDILEYVFPQCILLQYIYIYTYIIPIQAARAHFLTLACFSAFWVVLAVNYRGTYGEY